MDVCPECRGREQDRPWCPRCGPALAAAAPAGPPGGAPWDPLGGLGSAATGAFPAGPGRTLPGAAVPGVAAVRPGLELLDTLRSTPYLGPDPAPSAPLAVYVKVAAGAGAAAFAVLALGEIRAAGLNAELARGRTPALNAAIAQDNRLVGWAVILVVVATLIHLALASAWRRNRRPRAVHEASGEAYVESPLVLVMTGWFRTAMLVVWVVFLLSFGLWLTSRGTVAAVVANRRYLAVTSLSAAASMVLSIARVVLAERAYRARLAWSQAFRAAPHTVPYVPAVSERQVVRARQRARRAR